MGKQQYTGATGGTINQPQEYKGATGSKIYKGATGSKIENVSNDSTVNVTEASLSPDTSDG